MVMKLSESYPESLRKQRPIVLSAASLSHGFGLINALFLTHSLGGTLVVPGNQERLLDTLINFQVDRLFAWPAHYQSLLSDLKNSPTKLSKLTWCISSSFPINSDINQKLRPYLNIPVRQQYGMTETGPLSINTDLNRNGSNNCVGKALRGVEFMIIDDKGHQMKSNQKGNITVKIDYYLPKGLSPASEHFFHTGDIGSLDDNGRLNVFGRHAEFTDERREM